MTAELWRMGATPVPVSRIDSFALAFEEAGWDGLAVGEAHGLIPDPYPVLAAAAAATSILKVGTAVAVPLRAPLLAASAIATLSALSGGRARICLGRGDGAVKVLHREPTRVGEFELYLRELQCHLRREPVDLDGKPTSMARLDAIDPSLALEKPGVGVAATGPKTIAIAARHADGVDFSVGADLSRLEGCIALAREACREAGRDPVSLELGCFVQVAVTGRDDMEAREAIRGLVITHARFSGFEARPTGTAETAEHGSYRRAVAVMEDVYRTEQGGIEHRPGGAPGEIDFYPREAGADELIDRFAIVGPPELCGARLQEIVDLGIRRIYIGTRAVGVDLEERNTLRIGREVLPLLR